MDQAQRDVTTFSLVGLRPLKRDLELCREVLEDAWENLTRRRLVEGDVELELLALAGLPGRSKAVGRLLAGAISSLREAQALVREIEGETVARMRRTSPPLGRE